MKKLFIAALTMIQVYATDFALLPQCAAGGFGKFVVMNSTGPINTPTLQVCSIRPAIVAILQRTIILGGQIWIVAWDIHGHIIELGTPGFDTGCSEFQKRRAQILAHPERYKNKQFTFVSQEVGLIGAAIILGPSITGIIDANTQLQNMASSSE